MMGGGGLAWQQWHWAHQQTYSTGMSRPVSTGIWVTMFRQLNHLGMQCALKRD